MKGLPAKQSMEASKLHNRKAPLVTGVALILIGAATLFSRYLSAGWIPMVLLPIAGTVLLVEGVRSRSIALMIPASLLFFTGLGIVFALSSMVELGLFSQVGVILLLFGVGWVGICLATVYFDTRRAWWALVPAGLAFSLGLSFILTSLQALDFVFYITLGLGVALLAWGVLSRLLGLIISGALLVSVGPGIYLAWGQSAEVNSLAQTGVMLVWFSLGWGLIILFTRMALEKFIWWPLIPGAVLAVVGWGLYIGGNPGNAATFIANTGSIGLIIFGLYLLLLRSGLHH